MADEQPQSTPNHKESQLAGVTIRGWLAMIIVITVCAMSLLRIDVKEPLYTLVISAVSFYMGARANNMTNSNPEKKDAQNGAV